MGKKTWYSTKDFTADMEGKTAEIRLRVQVDAHTFANIPHTFVAVNLNGSAVAASTEGSMAINRNDMRGWFTEFIDVEFHIGHDRFTVNQDSPATTVCNGAVSSSTSLSADVGAGTFGTTPTSNVGAGASMGWSFSRNMTDLTITNRSTNTLVSHHYRLSMSKGGKYDNPSDLVDLSPYGQLTGACLHELPDIAIANVPLISQAIFISDGYVDEEVMLNVLVRQKVRKIEKTFKFFTVDIASWDQVWSGALQCPLALADTLDKKPNA